MRTTLRPTAALLVCLLACAGALAQEPSKQPTGSISGTVTIGGKPAAGVAVLLYSRRPNQRMQTHMTRATADGEGRFEFTGLAPGAYLVSPGALAYVGPSVPRGISTGESVIVSEGESVDGVDLPLVRGGVVTGLVTDAAGRPIVGMSVRLFATDPQVGQPSELYLPATEMFKTDDRGVYRMFGLPAGRYVVAVGEGEEDMGRMYGGMRRLPLTYHPNAASRAQATVVEVSPGGETKNVDIAVGRPSQTFSASGRVVDAETGSPVASIRTVWGPIDGDGSIRGYMGGSVTNASGEFRVAGLRPGRYAIGPRANQESAYYGTAISVDVRDSDVGGLEIRLTRGGTISGTLVLEGMDAAAIASQYSQFDLSAAPEEDFQSSEYMASPARARIEPDGSFRITGVRPGRNRLRLGSRHLGLPTHRVERDGVDMREGFEVAAGEEITNVRVIVAYGTGTLRCRVNARGGLPQNARLTMYVMRSGSEMPFRTAPADSRGQFLIENLLPGAYIVRLLVTTPDSSGGITLRKQVQSVNISNGATTEVSFDLDLTPRQEGEQQ